MPKMPKMPIISFEGIDATGKQTLSNLLDIELFESFKKNPIKIEIPVYDSPSGKEIKNILLKGNYDPELLQIKFALNRKETQNDLSLKSKLGNLKKDFIIFDRWVDSGAIFKIGKLILKDLEESNFGGWIHSKEPDSINKKDETIENFLFKYKEELIKQWKLEHTTLKLKIPDLKVLCVTPIGIVEERLINRLIEKGIPKAEVPFHLDSHEKDPDLLYIIQYCYNYIYSNPKVFFPSEIFPKRSSKHYLILDTSTLSKEECINKIIKKLNLLGLIY